MTRRIVLAVTAAAVAIAAGCAPRSDAPGTYTEGGIGTPFYAEVTYAAKEGQKPRIYLFGKIAHFEEFQATKDVPENAHKKYIGKGANRETVVVRDLMGYEAKEEPDYTAKLLAKYQARHPAAAPAAE